MNWYHKRTLGEVLEEAANKFGNRNALIFNDERWTYEDFNRETDKVAKSLLAIGVTNGEHVAVWMTNRPEWLFLMFAIARVGGCIVPLNTRYRTDDLAYTVAQSESASLIALAESGPINYQEMLANSIENISFTSKNELSISNYPKLKRIIIHGEVAISGALSWEAFLHEGQTVSDEDLKRRIEEVDPDGRMMIAYTSGTTGTPKGVVHSHIPIRNTMERAQALGLTCHDVHMNYLPLFHIYAYSEISMMCVLTGAAQVLTETFEPDLILDIAKKEKATILHGFEAHWLDLLSAQEKNQRELNIRLGTLPSGVESTIPIAERVQDVFCPTVSGFGMSETWAFVSISNLSHSREQRVHSSGYPMNDYEFKVVDFETKEEMPKGEPGELWIRGYATMNAYWNKPEASSETKDKEGWIRSGDMAKIRDDNMVVFLGRYKDMLKVGGENVSPAEVEAYLRNMDEILDAAVVSYPDQRLAEVPVAFIILKEDRNISEAELKTRMKGKIASFKIPLHFLVVDAFPMTPSGKIRKVELREKALEELGDP